MTDALAGHTDALVEELTLATGGNYRFFGGGAGDDGRFQKTHVFAGTRSRAPTPWWRWRSSRPGRSASASRTAGCRRARRCG